MHVVVLDEGKFGNSRVRPKIPNFGDADLVAESEADEPRQKKPLADGGRPGSRREVRAHHHVPHTHSGGIRAGRAAVLRRTGSGGRGLRRPDTSEEVHSLTS